MTDLVLLSGGLDSTTALAWSHDQGRASAAVTIDYGQRHARELEAARAVAGHYRVPLHVLDFTGWGKLLTGSALTDPDVEVPAAAYDQASMADTVVPNRNATFLMAAAGVAQSLELSRVITAVHGGDHDVYPDCRPEFITAAAAAAELGTGGAVTIEAPFVSVSKAVIAGLGATLEAPLHLTWSCYQGGAAHCGRCGTCVERREAFEVAGVTDPTDYC